MIFAINLSSVLEGRKKAINYCQYIFLRKFSFTVPSSNKGQLTMTMKNLATWLFCLIVTSLHAWQLDSTYKIVLPEKTYDQSVYKFLGDAAEALQKSFADRGIQLPVVRQEVPEPGQKSIFIGFPDGREYKYFEGSSGLLPAIFISPETTSMRKTGLVRVIAQERIISAQSRRLPDLWKCF